MAGRPRKPDDLLKLSGAHVKNPDRFKDRKPPKVPPIGPPPKHFDGMKAAKWKLLCEEIPWLGRSDRTLLMVAVDLAVKLDTDELTMGGMTELRQVLVAMGATPSARSKIYTPDDDKDEDDPAAKFFDA